jgi:hypothetical protein
MAKNQTLSRNAGRRRRPMAKYSVILHNRNAPSGVTAVVEATTAGNASRQVKARKREFVSDDFKNWKVSSVRRENPGSKKKGRSPKLGKRAAAVRRKVAKNPGRRNPVESAAETYRGFHGREPEEIITVKETLHEHTVLPGIGKLVFLEVAPVDGGPLVVIGADPKTADYKTSGFRGALLASNEKVAGKPRQLFIRGGDQSVDLKVFGIQSPHEREVLGAVVRVGYFTTKDHLDPRDGGTAPYIHKFGFTRKNGRHVRLAGSRLPMLVYDARNKLLEFAGGGYTIPDEGIDG